MIRSLLKGWGSESGAGGDSNECDVEPVPLLPGMEVPFNFS